MDLKLNQPLTVISSKTFCPARDDKRTRNDDENSVQKDVGGSMAPKSFYPVRVEPKRRPALMPITPRAFYQVKATKKKTSKSPNLGPRFGSTKKKKPKAPKPRKQPKKPKIKSPKAR